VSRQISSYFCSKFDQPWVSVFDIIHWRCHFRRNPLNCRSSCTKTCLCWHMKTIRVEWFLKWKGVVLDRCWECIQWSFWDLDCRSNNDRLSSSGCRMFQGLSPKKKGLAGRAGIRMQCWRRSCRLPTRLHPWGWCLSRSCPQTTLGRTSKACRSRCRSCRCCTEPGTQSRLSSLFLLKTAECSGVLCHSGPIPNYADKTSPSKFQFRSFLKQFHWFTFNPKN